MSNTIQVIIIYALVLGVMLIPSYLSNKKRKKKQKDMINSFKIGDKIITIGGISGEIVNVLTEMVEIKVDKGVKLTIKKTAIVEVLK